MVKEEWKEGVAILKSAYTNKDFLPDALSWNVWLEALKDIPYEVVKRSIVVYLQTNHFPPAISDLREIALRFMPEQTTGHSEMEAWALVSKAAGNSTWHSEEEFNKLPEIVQKAVGSPSVLKEWAQLDSEVFASITQSHFLRTYRSVQTRENESAQLSLPVRQALGIEAKTEPQIDKAIMEVIPKIEETERYRPSDEQFANFRAMLRGFEERNTDNG